MSTNSTIDQRLRKQERLRSKKQIEVLFRKGKAVKAYPFLCVWQVEENEQPFPAQMAVSVAKKRVKKAVDRNLVKRRVREAYRTNKGALYAALEEKKLRLKLMLIFTGKELPNHATVEKEIKRTIDRLIQALP